MLSIILIMLSYYLYFLTVDKSYKSKKKTKQLSSFETVKNRWIWKWRQTGSDSKDELSRDEPRAPWVVQVEAEKQGESAGERTQEGFSKNMNSKDTERNQTPPELQTITWHRAERWSGFKSRCWLYSMCCRRVDRHRSDQKQRHGPASPGTSVTQSTEHRPQSDRRKVQIITSTPL